MATSTAPTAASATTVALARRLRADSIRCTTAAGSGHPTSAMSAADLMAVLLANHLRYDFDDPMHPSNDRLILSKGHASPLLYAMYAAAGAISDDELLTLRHFGSRLQGHPTTALPYIVAATGSLGQGLPVGVGIALTGIHLDHLPFTVWTLLGDAEMAEGSVWEAFDIAAHYRLDNLVAIIDVNRLGQRGPTALEWQLDRYRARVEAFGWEAIVIDGHDHVAIERAYAQTTQRKGRPYCIIAQTTKGHGVSFTADAEGWHGRAMKHEEAAQALAEIAAPPNCRIHVRRPENRLLAPAPPAADVVMPAYTVGDAIATRQAFGDALRALGAANDAIVVFDAEVANSTRAEEFAEQFPGRFFEMFIAEQVMVSVAQGAASTGKIAFAATFGAFLSRAHDQIRMAGISGADLRLCGSHAGVSIGEDGPSQMALEDLAMMRAIDQSTVLYPADAVSTSALTAAMVRIPGISYLRTTRAATPVLYPADETFRVGGSKVLRSSIDDAATVVGAGITVHEALKAAEQLEHAGISVRVIDCYSVKPVDAPTLRQAADETGIMVVAEDHRIEGGLGEAVLSALAASGKVPVFVHLGIRSLPASGRPQQLLDHHGISARHIVAAVLDHLARQEREDPA